MFTEDLLPAALAACKSRRATPRQDGQIGRPSAAPERDAGWNAAALPPHMIAVAPETQTALAAVSDVARSRCVELQMAVAPRLIARAAPADYQTWLRHLLLGAIGRASSGVLVTAMQQADGVEIAVLDDGTAAAGGRPDGATQAAGDPAVPVGGTLHAEYRPEHGTTIRLHLPQPDRLPLLADADALDGMAGFRRSQPAWP